ncbi:hypothetical protein ACWDA7_47345 [Streptomyces sp. NPDC001156]
MSLGLDPHDHATRVRPQGVGHVKAHQRPPVVGQAKTISITCEGKRLYATLTAEQPAPEPFLVGRDHAATGCGHCVRCRSAVCLRVLDSPCLVRLLTGAA